MHKGTHTHTHICTNPLTKTETKPSILANPCTVVKRARASVQTWPRKKIICTSHTSRQQSNNAREGFRTKPGKQQSCNHLLFLCSRSRSLSLSPRRVSVCVGRVHLWGRLLNSSLSLLSLSSFFLFFF